MAGIDVAVGGDGHILTASATATHALDDTGALGEVHVEVEEVDVVPVQQLPGQVLVLLQNAGQVLLLEGVVILGIAHHRLHRHVAEALVSDVDDVLGEIPVVTGEGTTQVVVLVTTSSHQLLELGENYIVAALAVDGGAHVVVDLRAAIQREHGVGHVLVDVIDGLIVQQDAVGGDGEPEVLVVLLLQGTGVVHGGLDGVHGHEGLAAEEVHLDVVALAGAGDDEVNGLLGGLHIHGHAVAGTEVAGGGKAVLATQVAVVGDVEAQGLDGGILLHEHSGLRVDVGIVREEKPLLLQLVEIVPGAVERLAVVLGQLGSHLVGAVLCHGAVQQGQQVVSGLVQHMHGTAVHIHRDIRIQTVKSMYHNN